MEFKLKPIGINKYELEPVAGMQVEAVVYCKEEMLAGISQDKSLEQLSQAAMLPKIISPVIAMPDIHEGYGIPIGGVMVTDGLISVGGVGMDINCGVRLLKTNLKYNPQIFDEHSLIIFSRAVERFIPLGLGSKRKEELPRINLRDIIIHGSQALVKAGYATEQDIDHTEENGKLAGAKIEALSEKALKRSADELGTLGSGNHFIDLQKISQIFDQEIASQWGLQLNQICLMIHSGSRALGQQTCLDYTDKFYRAQGQYGIQAPTRSLASLPIDSAEGQAYFAAMAGAVNFAFANRQLMTHQLRQVFSQFFGKKLKQKIIVETLYDVCHNIAKWEVHQSKEVLVHRKGATRALPAGHPQNPKSYQASGHPAIIPGSMGTPSYIVVGLPKAEETFFSVNHGAGRTMSRTQAKREINQGKFEEQMKDIVYNRQFGILKDEAPDAYKDINLVVDTLVEAGITKKVVALKPLAVIVGR